MPPFAARASRMQLFDEQRIGGVGHSVGGADMVNRALETKARAAYYYFTTNYGPFAA